MDDLKHLYGALDKACSNLDVVPQPMPRGLKYGEELLLDFCRNDKEREEVIEMLARFAVDQGADGSQKLAVVGRFDVDRQVFSIYQCRYLSGDNYEMHDMSCELTDEVIYGISIAVSIQSILRAIPHCPVYFGKIRLDDEDTDIIECVKQSLST